MESPNLIPRRVSAAAKASRNVNEWMNESSNSKQKTKRISKIKRTIPLYFYILIVLRNDFPFSFPGIQENLK